MFWIAKLSWELKSRIQSVPVCSFCFANNVSSVLQVHTTHNTIQDIFNTLYNSLPWVKNYISGYFIS